MAGLNVLGGVVLVLFIAGDLHGWQYEQDLAQERGHADLRIERSEEVAVPREVDNQGCAECITTGLIGIIDISTPEPRLIYKEIATISRDMRRGGEGSIEIRGVRDGVTVTSDFTPSEVIYVEEGRGVVRVPAREVPFVLTLSVPFEKLEIYVPGSVKPKEMNLKAILKEACALKSQEALCIALKEEWWK